MMQNSLNEDPYECFDCKGESEFEYELIDNGKSTGIINICQKCTLKRLEEVKALVKKKRASQWN